MGSGRISLKFLTGNIPSMRLPHAGHPCALYAVSTAVRFLNMPWRTRPRGKTLGPVSMKTVSASIAWKCWQNRHADFHGISFSRKERAQIFRRVRIFSSAQEAL